MAKKEEKKINIELTKDEIILLNNLCMEEIFNIGQLQYQRFVDKVAVMKHLEEVKMLLQKLPSFDE